MPGTIAATPLYVYATPIPIPINVNMFRLRFTIDFQPRWKKGHPPQSTTGVASINSIQFIKRGATACINGCPGMEFAIAMKISGTLITRLIQNRRVISRNSGLGPSTAGDTDRGSSAMPQIGQAPGSACTPPGCIGQVYADRVCDAGGYESVARRDL